MLDRASDPQRIQEYSESMNVDCGLPPDHWFLEQCAVSPNWQRRGIGEKLLRWGMETARRENVPCGLESSRAGFGLYQRLGFDVKERKRFNDKIDSVWMVWEP